MNIVKGKKTTTRDGFDVSLLHFEMISACCCFPIFIYCPKSLLNVTGITSHTLAVLIN